MARLRSVFEPLAEWIGSWNGLDVVSRDQGIHPIIEEAARLATPDLQGRVDFSEEALNQLRSSLKRLEATPDLPAAVMGLVTFAAHLHRDCNSEQGGIRLLDVAAEMAGPMRQRVVEMELARDGADKALGFLASTDPRMQRSAPSSGASAASAAVVVEGKRSKPSGLRVADLVSRRSLNRKGVRR